VPREFDIGGLIKDRLLETYPNLGDKLQDHPTLTGIIGAVTHASDFLTRLLIADAQTIDVLSDLDQRPPCNFDHVDELVRWKRLELLRIAARDLVGRDSLEVVGANLAHLAEDVLAGAAKLAEVDHELVIVGMGKLGGSELNYASDIDVMFVGNGNEAGARNVMDIARKCFRVDAALRPEGRDGALVRTIDSFRQYWAQSAQTWEFQALLKARPLTGPLEKKQEWAEAARQALWQHPFGADELREVRAMKARAEAIVKRKGLDARELKRAPGGIRDIEFAVQLLQLVHGGSDHDIRSATTLTALDELTAGGYIDANDAKELANAYRFLRTVEHRLQLVEEEQTHTVPNDSIARARLAATMGFEGPNPLNEFDDELRRTRSIVRHAHEKLYFRPLLEAFARGDVGRGAEIQLSAFGFRDASRTRQAVDELTHGLARSSRLMQQLMPLLFDWLSQSPNPDDGLLGLRKLISGFRTPTHIVNTFRDSPEAARRLCLLLGTGRLFVPGMEQHPEVLDDTNHDDLLIPSASYLDRMRVALGWRQDSEARHVGLNRLARAERLRVACGDVIGLIDNTEAMNRRTQLADAVLTLTTEALQPPVPIALIAMGRYGGGELGYGSDLDLVVIHDGQNSDDQLAAENFAQELMRLINTGVNKLYAIDYDLRPEGRKGVLARSLTGCAEYYEKWASTWERQALIRARFAAGSPEVAAAFFDIIKPFVWEKPVGNEELREIRHLKARMERERIPRSGDAKFHLKLGPGSLSDVEWTVQLLQLRARVTGNNTMTALDELCAEGIVNQNDTQILKEAWQFCDSTRNRIFIVENEAGNALPADVQNLSVLARSLGISDLRDRYLQVTRRCRHVTEKLFYGQTGQ
jgi:[glutamine synthetase] adenylyltransferase / [glutamine synthetase]-adenylyl-L-tyrosine phosphorylase